MLICSYSWGKVVFYWKASYIVCVSNQSINHFSMTLLLTTWNHVQYVTYIKNNVQNGAVFLKDNLFNSELQSDIIKGLIDLGKYTCEPSYGNAIWLAPVYNYTCLHCTLLLRRCFISVHWMYAHSPLQKSNIIKISAWCQLHSPEQAIPRLPHFFYNSRQPGALCHAECAVYNGQFLGVKNTCKDEELLRAPIHLHHLNLL
jgi:hypothetical protein